jgi:deazaflavin-dependent oxidoreductase (nitroreductase family)
MPSDSTFRGLNRLHQLVLKVTGGRVGWKAAGMQVIELTTTGAKTGERRTVILTSPRQEGDTIVVVASRGGTDRNPAWVHNIAKDASVTVSMKGRRNVPMLGRVADARERSRLWPLITADHGNYADYQAKTTREIPVVLLSPRP